MAEKIILSSAQIEKLAQVIGDFYTGSEITKFFNDVGSVEDDLTISTKWRRINDVFSKEAVRNGCSNNFVRFIRLSIAPERFADNPNKQEELLQQVNQILCFSGFEFRENGDLIRVSKATTPSEAHMRYLNLQQALKDRNVHHTILFSCREELLDENYFHAIFEASKNLLDEIRSKSRLNEDGVELIEKAFNIKNPYLVVADLATENGKNIQRGFKDLCNGITRMVRNVTAHTPKIKWIVEEKDALEILCMISFLFRTLDDSIVVPHPEISN